MKVPKRPTDTWEYSPKEYEGVTVTLKTLSCGDFDKCTALILKQEQPAALRLAASKGIESWTFDEPFSLDLLNQCEDSLVYELGGAVLQGAQLSETEKNS